MANDHTKHPADHIDHAQAMIRFLSSVMGAASPQGNLQDRELEGLCYILSHIDDNLKAALTKL